jgi:AraC-like DNA-binding protein
MRRVALMRAAILRPFERFLRCIGAPTDRIFERVRLSPDLLQDPEALVPVHAGTAFVVAAARVEGIEHLGATVAAQTGIHEIGTYGRAIARATSLHEFATTIREFHAGHHSGERYWLEASGDRMLLCQCFTAPADDWGGQASQYSILIATGALTAIARRPWRPTVYMRKDVSHAVVGTPWMERADVRFGHDRCAIEIDPLVLPLVVPREESRSFATRELVDWYRTRPADELASSLRQWLACMLRTDAVRVEVLAETLGTTPRTLQRRLGEAGTSYARVLGEARFEVATRLLARDDLEVREVAREVGYRDAAHLTRAFRRWSGMTPSELRRRLRASAVSTQSAGAIGQSSI